jgi:ankyrin repeat protein
MRFAVLVPVLIGALLLPADQRTDLLARAARKGDVAQIQALLASGADPNFRDGYGLAPLHYAASFNQAEVTAALLKGGADPNDRVIESPRHMRDQCTPLQYAADRGNAQIASLLIAAGAKVNETGQTGRTALHFAARRGYVEVVRLLLDAKADPNVRDADGSSPLDEAVWTGSAVTVAILLRYGAHLNSQQTKTGATPVNEAAFLGNTPVLRYLLEERADVSIPDKRGYDPLENSIRMKREPAALLLLESEFTLKRGNGYYAHIMEAAVRAEQASTVEALLKNGVGVNTVLPAGATALSEAAANGFTPGVQLLLAHGADLKVVDANGASPLQDASLKGFAGIVSLLLDHGAPVNATDRSSGATALYAAASFGRREVAMLLLNHGADPNICTKEGRSPYRAASENGYGEIADEIAVHRGRASCKGSE